MGIEWRELTDRDHIVADMAVIKERYDESMRCNPVADYPDDEQLTVRHFDDPDDHIFIAYDPAPCALLVTKGNVMWWLVLTPGSEAAIRPGLKMARDLLGPTSGKIRNPVQRARVLEATPELTYDPDTGLIEWP